VAVDVGEAGVVSVSDPDRVDARLAAVLGDGMVVDAPRGMLFAELLGPVPVAYVGRIAAVELAPMVTVTVCTLPTEAAGAASELATTEVIPYRQGVRQPVQRRSKPARRTRT
jgi:hypothetical protein